MTVAMAIRADNQSAANVLRVLVVEDEPEIRSTLVTGLARAGYVVSAVGNGDEAVATLASEEFDIVLLDLRIPGRSGIQVLQAMRADAHDAEVIIINDHADTETVIEALRLQAVDYITKPFRLNDLLHVVGR